MMKLRIKGDSLRLRISPSELARLVKSGRIEETIHFGPAPDARLTYALEQGGAMDELGIRYQAGVVTVLVAAAALRAWADGDAVGLYGRAPAGDGTLELVVEKDFACLDRDEEENRDTFPHPKQGAAC